MSKEYTARNIDVYEGLEGVREKPSIYIGDLKDAIFGMVKECVDNCVVGDTLVFTNKGILPINCFCDENRQGSIPYTCSILTKDGIENTSHSGFYGYRETKKIELYGGYYVVGSLDNPLLSYDKETLELSMKRISSLKEGDLLGVKISGDLWAETVPDGMSVELSRLLGYLVAEGYISDKLISFCNSSLEVVDDFLYCLEYSFKNCCYSKHSNKDGIVIEIRDKSVLRSLYNLGLVPCLSFTQQIPKIILESPKICIKNFLKAYFEGDGSIIKERVEACSLSYKLLSEIQIILLNFGVFSILRKDKYENKRQDNHDGYIYKLWITTHKNIFIQEIGFVTKKTSLLKDTPIYSLPGFTENINNLIERKRIGKNKSSWYMTEDGRKAKLRLTCGTSGKNRYDTNKNNIYKFLDSIKKLDSCLYDKMLAILKIDNTIWLPISSIENKGTQKVYDFRVPNSKTFIANGIISRNCIDEFLVGENSRVLIQIDRRKPSVIVADRGRGIPVENHHKTGISTLTTVLTTLHAGGKFSSKEMTVGTHGVGVSVANALSSSLEVWTYRSKNFQESQDGSKTWYNQSFIEGRAVTGVSCGVNPPIDWKSGTVIMFTPDPSIFVKNYRIPVKKIKEWLKDIQYLCSGLEFKLIVDDEEEIYKSKQGISQWVSEISDSKKLTACGKKFEYCDDKIQVALQWTDTDEEMLRTYVNCCATQDHGSHFNGFRKALSESLSLFSEEKYNKEDLRLGLVCILHYRTANPTYTTQTKERLTSDIVEEEVKNILLPQLTTFFQQNKSLTDLIINKAIKLKQARDRFKQDKATIKSITLVSKSTKHVLPRVLSGAPRCKPVERELFICEGKSAHGTLKNARDPKYQEILPLKGKFPNAIKYPTSKFFQNEDVKNIFVSIGSNQNVKDLTFCDPKKARVGKVILLPDEDVDGKHIRCLGLSLIMAYMKELIDNGMVFVVSAPLYVASYKDKKYFANTLEELKKQIPKLSSAIVTRMKGWGECLTKNTMIPSNKGFLRIDTLVENNFKNLIINSPFCDEEPVEMFKTGFRKTNTVLTRNGYTVSGTKDQELLTINRDTGYLEWKSIKNLNTDDFIAISRNSDLWSNSIPSVSVSDKKYTLTKELSRLLGYLVANGDNSVTPNCVFNINDKEAIDDFINCFVEVFPDNDYYVVNSPSTGSVSVKLGGKKLNKYSKLYSGIKHIRDVLDCIGFKKNCKAINKEIPWIILQSPKIFVKEFVKALFECDGHVEKNCNRIEYYTASKVLGNQIKIVLLNFGIVSSGYPIKGRFNPFTKTFDKNVYKCRIRISGLNTALWVNNIGFISLQKSNRLKKIFGKTSTDIIPYVKNIIKKKYKGKFNTGTSSSDYTHSYLKTNLNLIECVKKEDHMLFDTISFCIENNIFWDKIIENSSDVEENVTYDLTMPYSECFTGNGIVCHNCSKEDMKTIAMNPQTRVLYKINLSDQCEDRVNKLMGSDSIFRKQILGI